MKCPLALLRGYTYVINVYDFASKFPAISMKMAQKTVGDFCAPGIYGQRDKSIPAENDRA